MRTVWITGAAGFSGTHLISYLQGLADCPRIVGIDRISCTTSQADAWHQVDLHDSATIAALAARDRPDYLIHLAGAMPPTDDARMWHVNVGGTVSLLLALRSAECWRTRVVGIGSAAEYLPSAHALSEASACGGGTAYAHSKWAQTLLTLQLGRELSIPTLVGRTFNLIGPGLPERLVAGSLCRQFAAEPPVEEIEIGNTESARDFVDIRDAVSAYWLLAQAGEPGLIYNVCSGKASAVRELLDILGEITGRAPRIQVKGERVRQSDTTVSVGDPARLRGLGWAPRVTLRESLSDMVRDFAWKPG